MPARAGQAEEHEFAALRESLEFDRPALAACGVAREAEQVDVAELEALRSVDREHAHGIALELLGLGGLLLALLLEILAHERQQELEISVLLLEPALEALEEAREVLCAPVALVARRLAGFEQRALAQELEEFAQRAVHERAAQRVQRLERVDQALDPAFGQWPSADLGRNRARRLAHAAESRREPCAVASIELAGECREALGPERRQSRVGQAAGRRAQRAEQRDRVAGIDRARDP